MNILIVGGGTAGHLTPAMALYDEIKKHSYGVRFIISEKDMAIVANDKYDYDALKLSSPINFKRKIIFMVQFIFAFFYSIRYILKYKTDIIIGMGGYVSLPPLIAGIIMRRKIYLCEQNSIPGKVNKLLHKYAKKLYVTFSKTLEFFPNAKVFGNPVRSSFFDVNKSTSREYLGFNNSDKMLVIMGGSQGAKRVNEIVFDALSKIYSRYENLKVYWLCGKLWAEHYKNEIKSEPYKNNVNIIDFSNDMPCILSASDFVISRAGSSSISEIIALNLPSVLIPFPYAAENHQYYNAKELTDMNAAYLIEETSLTGEYLAGLIIENIFENNEKLQTMKENIKKLNMDNATSKILEDIFMDNSLLNIL